MIAFRVDGNRTIGMGHYTRCAAIADEMRTRGEEVLFLLAPDADADYLVEKGFSFYRLKEENENGWDPVETLKVVRNHRISTLVIDSYRVNAKVFSLLKKGCSTVYIDDMDTFDCDVDVVINFNPGVNEEEYRQQDLSGRKVFTGLKYYPLRKEFQGKRKNSVVERVSNVMITSGSTDPFQCVDRIIHAIEPESWLELHFRILVGLYYDNNYKMKLRKAAEEHSNVELVFWGNDVPKLLGDVDLLISSGSSMVLEALSINVPCITYQFVENHRKECISLQEEGMADFAGIYSEKDFPEKCMASFRNMLPYEYRKKQEERYSAWLDGNGTGRIAEIIRELDRRRNRSEEETR